MKKNFTRQALPAVAMLMVASLSLVGTTYAWFTQNEKASVTDIKVDITNAAGGIAVSDAIDGTYSTTFAVNNTVSKMNPASTGGAIVNVESTKTMAAKKGETSREARSVKFFTGAVSSSNLSKLDSISAAGTGDVVSFDIFFENTNNTAQDIYFNFADKTTGDNPTAVSFLKEMFALEDIANLKLSTEALRVGFVVQGTASDKANSWTANTDTSMLIFEPNWNAHLTQTGVASGLETYYGLSATSDGTIQGGLDIKGTSANSTYQTSITPKKVEDYNAYSGVGTGTDAKKALFQLPASSYTWVTVYVWIEGQDIDCLNSIAGEAFSFKLNFKSVEVKAS